MRLLRMSGRGAVCSGVNEGVIEQEQEDQACQEAGPSEGVQQYARGPSQEARAKVVGEQVDGDGYRAFGRFVFADNAVAKDMDDEEAEGENGQSEDHGPEIRYVEEEYCCRRSQQYAFEYGKGAVAAGEPDGSDRSEHAEDVHQVNVVDRDGREVEGFFDEVEAHVVVEAYEDPQEQSPGQVKRKQCPGGHQMQVGDDQAVQAFFAGDEMGGTGTEKYEQEGENSAYQSDAYRGGPP